MEHCIECYCLCFRWCEAGKVWGISARIMLRTMKFDIRRGSSDTKPHSDLSKERLRNYLNTVTNWEKVHFVCSHDLKK